MSKDLIAPHSGVVRTTTRHLQWDRRHRCRSEDSIRLCSESTRTADDGHDDEKGHRKDDAEKNHLAVVGVVAGPLSVLGSSFSRASAESKPRFSSELTSFAGL